MRYDNAAKANGGKQTLRIPTGTEYEDAIDKLESH
jgi:hypothetical protein